MLNVGEVLTLEPKYSDQPERYKCRVVDLVDNVLYIDYPISLKTNKSVFFLVGTELRATFAGTDGTSVFLFETEIKGRKKQKIPMLIISYPGKENLIKIQRRQYVRIETAIDMAVHSTTGEFPPLITVTDDFSAGGAAILIPKKFTADKDSILQFWFVLPMNSREYRYMKLYGKVIRIIEFNEARNKMSIQFLEISDHDRQLMLRFCFERQLDMKKKGS